MSRLARVSVLAIASLALAQPGCGSTGTNSQVIVTVDAQPGVRAMARTLVIRVYGGIVGESVPSLVVLEHPFDVSAATGEWPREVALTPRDRNLMRIYRFEASAYADATVDESSVPIATVRLISGYAEGQTLRVRLVLQDACIGVECGEDQTCDVGDCIDAHVDVDDLADGGRDMDAMIAEDAGVPGDAGPQPCDPAACDDGYSCTDDFCTDEGECGHTPHDDRCADTNLCTDDICTGGGAGVEAGTGCLRRPVSVGCDDGVFCNGNDVCADGVCTHSMDRCPGGLTCNEAMDSCDGCTSTAMCPPTMDTAWGTCGGFGDACDITGTQTATRISYTCTGGSCISTMTPLSQTCTRPSRDGASCGAPMFGEWSSCDWSDDCDEDAEQVRTRLEYVCMGTVCAGESIGETMPCSRNTDSMICSDGDPCTGPDRCMSGTCTSGGPTCSSDGGTGGCTSSAQCDDGVGCTTDVCMSGSCINMPGSCAPPDAGCATARCDLVADCVYDYSACTGECTTNADCNDSDPCSTDVCNTFMPPFFCEHFYGFCGDSGSFPGMDGGIMMMDGREGGVPPG